MTTAVRIPMPLRKLTGGSSEVLATGSTVAEVLDDLERLHPGFRDCLFDDHGIRRFVNLYVGEQDVRFIKGLATEVPSGASLTILLAIAGG